MKSTPVHHKSTNRKLDKTRPIHAIHAIHATTRTCAHARAQDKKHSHIYAQRPVDAVDGVDRLENIRVLTGGFLVDFGGQGESL